MSSCPLQAQVEELYWFNGTAWVAVNDSSNNPVFPNGDVYAFNLSDSTSPTLAQLSGTPFAGGSPEVWLELAPGYDTEFYE